MLLNRQKEKISYKRFPWTHKTVNLLIDSYAKKISILLDPARQQAGAWRFVVDNMKRELQGEEGFDEDVLSVLTPSRAISKFYALKKNFKKFYFCCEKTEIEKQQVFAYYDKMNALFTEYATNHLNSSISLANRSSLEHHEHQDETEPALSTTLCEVTEADVTNYIVQFLNDEDMNKTSLTIQGEDQENFSHGEKMRVKLSEMPTEAISICRETLRLEPNTPFSRSCSNATILHQRSLLLHQTQHHATTSMKRKLDGVDYGPSRKGKDKKKQINAHSSKAENKTNNSEYLIEVLDECELSDISVRRSKAIYHDSPTDISQDHEHQTATASSTNAVNDQSRIEIHSILEIPPFPMCDDNEEMSIDVARQENLLETIKRVRSKEIVPKKLNVHESTTRASVGSNSITLLNEASQDEEEPPAWFRSFLKRYNEDVRKINEKLDTIIYGYQEE